MVFAYTKIIYLSNVPNFTLNIKIACHLKKYIYGNFEIGKKSFFKIGYRVGEINRRKAVSQ